MKRASALPAVMLCLLIGPKADAQPVDWPVKPIRMVVPFAPGGNTDVVTRMTAQGLQPLLGQPMIVENRSGAGGVIAMEYVAKSVPDGYTLLMSSTGPHVISPSLVAKLPYDPIKDIAPISNVSSNALVLMVHPSVPARTAKELIALARRMPSQLSYGSAGVGGTTHLSGEMFGSMAGVKLVHVPFRGGAPATAAALGGEVAMTFANLSDALPQIKAGKLRPLGITSATRQPQLPDLSTIGEAALPGYEVIVWNGLVAPGATSPEIISRMASAVQKVVREPAFRTRLTEIGSVAIGDTPEQFRAFVAREMARWAKVVKDSGAKAE